MCLELLARHECGCLSKVIQRVQICSNYQLMEDLKALGYPEWDGEVRYCHDVCNAESKQQYVWVSAKCASCRSTAEAKEWGVVSPI
jgi:hypothetical protein